MDRRHFLMGSAAALTAASSVFGSPNDTVRVAVIGVGGHDWTSVGKGKAAAGRGQDHLRGLSKLENVEVAAVCDVDESHLNYGLNLIEKATNKKPKGYGDFRKLLEDKDIDAVSIATPNHWHTPIAIMACQAGKDVYVEKPCSHNMFEARQIVAAARKYDRMVQQGSQIRSSLAVQEAVQKMREGLIGDVYLSRGLCFKWRDTIGRTPVSPVPPGVDYDLWTGPAPKHEFSLNRFHYNWHWFWDYGNGDLGNQGIHEMDVARWGLGVKYPTKVSAIGGHFMFDDDQETPNTLNCAFEFNEDGKHKMLEFEVRHWMSNGEATVGPNVRAASATAAARPPRPAGAAPASSDDSAAENGGARRGFSSDSIGNIFYGSKGFLAVDSYSSYKSWLGKEQAPGPERREGGDHYLNFIEAVRSRKRDHLNAEIEEGASSTILVHLANISYRVGRTLHFDSKTMSVTGDAEANKLFTKVYRKPFVVPEKV
ncbi:MAG TPA: Gfo/Idh/MocA family oxidoreductase [Bryobacteraceae bacterium]|nr:Gfo/Idh/MocA family oxidoreductase [Bryobacteraceae bacterium]